MNAQYMAIKFKIKFAMAGRDEPRRLRALNRSISSIKWAQRGMEYESNHSHQCRAKRSPPWGEP